MIKLNFYLKSDKVNNREEYPIYLKLIYKGKSTTLSTGKWISKERWNSTNKLRNSLRIDKEKNCRLALDRIAEGIENTFYKLLKTENDISVLGIKNKYTGKTDKKKGIDVLHIFEIHNKNFQKKVNIGERSKASLQKYARAKSLLKEFIFKRYRKKTFQLVR